MSLKSVYVREDWEARVRQRQRTDQTQWTVILLTLSGCALLSLVVFQVPFREELFPRAARAIISTLFLIEGIHFLYRPAHPWRFMLGSGAFAFLGILASTAATNAAIVNRSLDPLSYNLLLFVIGLGLLAPAWSILLALRFRNRERFQTTFPATGSWGRRFIYGLASGGTIAGLLFLSQAYTGLPIFRDLPPAPVLVYTLAYSLGLASLGEEVFFRGLIFQQVFKRREKKLWTAILLTLVLNLLPYAAEIYVVPTGGYLALLLLGLQAPAVMILVNCTLYAWKGNLVSPVVSNMIFRLFWLMMGAR